MKFKRHRLERDITLAERDDAHAFCRLKERYAKLFGRPPAEFKTSPFGRLMVAKEFGDDYRIVNHTTARKRLVKLCPIFGPGGWR